MSRIFVDELPGCAEDCPFVSDKLSWNKLCCCSFSSYENNPCPCDLEEGNECSWLIELPKEGDKHE